MSSADTAAPDTEAEGGEEPVRDEVREGMVDAIRAELGDAVLGSHIRPGDDVWVRVDRRSWRAAAEFAKGRFRCDFFDFVSAIDWLPSPFGRDMNSQEDVVVHGQDPKEPPQMTSGYAGGDTRFQMLARVASTEANLGITFKADLPDDDLAIESWIPVYAGADWHERELHEMFGIDVLEHPHLVKLYLPSEFEGFPLRKDFPLLARRVKPWPGIVDVEPMPGGGGDEKDAAQ